MKLVTQSKLQVADLPGVWRCCYWFPSNNHPGEDVSAYYVRIERAAEGFALHSLPQQSGAYMQAHIAIDSNMATGTWLEDTSPTGDFKGMQYSGSFQLLISEDVRRMEGMWVGVGRGGGTPKIYEGRWEITYAGDSEADLPEL